MTDIGSVFNSLQQNETVQYVASWLGFDLTQPVEAQANEAVVGGVVGALSFMVGGSMLGGPLGGIAATVLGTMIAGPNADKIMNSIGMSLETPSPNLAGGMS